MLDAIKGFCFFLFMLYVILGTMSAFAWGFTHSYNAIEFAINLIAIYGFYIFATEGINR